MQTLMNWTCWTCTHPACPVHQVVQLGDDILALAAGYSCWLGCCHCCALLSDGNHTVTEGWRERIITMCGKLTESRQRSWSADWQTHLVDVFSLLALLCRLLCWRANAEMGLLKRTKIRQRNHQLRGEKVWKLSIRVGETMFWYPNCNVAVCWIFHSTNPQQCEPKVRFQSNVSDDRFRKFYQASETW